MLKLKNMILKPISSGKLVVISATKGTDTLAFANDVFSYIDPNLKNWGCDKIEKETPEMAVEVYEQIEDATYPEIFGSVDQNLDHLVLTTSQIKNFVVNNAKDYLLEAEWTCFRFLFKTGDEFFIADVRVLNNGNRDVRVTRFLDGSVRHAEYRHRIVVPQLAE
ncbi:MAG: hypothetical protein RL094_351 [Candidatus Parcubacteria bacterium]|jgi:hypothetical protein